MSNFICEKCGVSILDSDMGYITGCEHYPVEVSKSTKKRVAVLKAWSEKNKGVMTMPCDKKHPKGTKKGGKKGK